MAQTIKHRRGSVSSVRNITSFGEAELVIGSGSVDGKVDGPIVYIGKPGGTSAANDYAPISKIYTGAGIPSMTPGNFGSTMDGLPYYDSTNKKLYILGSHADGESGHTEIIITTSSLQNFDNHVSASAAAAGFGAGGSDGIFVLESGAIYRSSDKDLQITGSNSDQYALKVSQSIQAHNINAGVPTSNDWQNNLDGSYFNNFTKDTDVSEILRFIAGLLSSSAADASPNSRTYSTIVESFSSTSGTGTISGRVSQNHDIDDITYLVDQGFASVGGTLFPGKTVRTNTGYSVSYRSNSGGTSDVQSSADSQLFGLGKLTSGGPTEFRVSGSHIWEFDNNNSGTLTETSSSAVILSNSSFGTSNGLTLGKINTVNPTVIPAAYQDGKFSGVFSQNLIDWTSESLTSVSSSGTYTITTTIGIETGSQSTYVTAPAVSEEIFWAPISTINTNIGTTTPTDSNTATTALTLTSSSLSGAPYVTGGTYRLISSASGLFNPMYVASTTAARVVISSPTPSNVSVAKTSGTDTLSTNGGTIQTSNAVFSETGNTVRATSTVPHKTDRFHTNATYTLSGTGTTFSENGFADTDFTLSVRGTNRNSSETNMGTETVEIHSAGAFNQPAASGSMGYFGGGTASTATVERFSNETYRRQIGTSTGLTTAWDSEDRITLGDGGDLQVKPGFLVNAESTTNGTGYWYPTSGYNAAH